MFHCSFFVKAHARTTIGLMHTQTLTTRAHVQQRRQGKNPTGSNRTRKIKRKNTQPTKIPRRDVEKKDKNKIGVLVHATRQVLPSRMYKCMLTESAQPPYPNNMPTCLHM